jgi:enediyne biosynthesis protein E4
MGQFKPIELNESGFYVPNDARALSKVRLANNKELILATQNRGELKVFAPNQPVTQVITPQKNEVKAVITFKNGQKRLQEFYLGHSFLSQYPLSISLNSSILEVSFFDKKNVATRKIAPTM